MIFKTFNSDIDKISSKWGMVGKSFNDIGAAIIGRITDINKAFQATDDLVGSIKNSDSIWKRLYPSKESINGKLIDIDSLYPERTDGQFSSLLSNLVKIEEKVKSGSGSWQKYFNGLGEGEKWQIEFVQNTDLQKASLSDVKKAYDSARQSALDHNAALKQQTLGAKAASAGLSLLKTAGNAVVSMGIAMLASFAINGIITLITNACQSIDEKIKNLNEDLDKSVQRVKSISDEFKFFKNSADEIIPQYAKLAQGVDKFGKNISLTDEEYQKFIELNNQIGEMFPEINVGLDSNGNAMLALSGNADTLTESLYNLVEAQRVSANQKIADGFDDAFDNANSLNNAYESSISKHNFRISRIRFVYNEISRLAQKGNGGVESDLLKRFIISLKNSKEEYFVDKFRSLRDKYTRIISPNSTGGGREVIDWSDLFNDKEFIKLYEDSLQKHEIKINEFSKKIKLAWKKLGSSVSAVIADNPIYMGLNEQEKQLANILGSGIDFENLEDKSAEGVKKYIEANILTPLLSLPDDSFSIISALQDSLKSGKISFEEFKEQFIKEYKAVFDTLYSDMDSEQQITFADNFVRAFNAIGIEGNQVTAILNNLADSYDKVTESAENAVQAQKSYEEIVSEVEGLTEALENLGKIYVDVQNKENFDWGSILNNEDFKKLFGDYTEAYDEFIKIITKNPDNIEACQNAFNKLVGEYVYGSGALNNLTEDTKDAAVAMLEQNGIVNAAEIVAAKLKQLAIAKANEVNMSELLKKKTLEEKIAFLEEIQMSGDTAQALLDLALEKIRFNNTKLNTSKDIAQLVALAKQAGVSAAVISKFKNAMDMTENEEFDEEKFNWGKKLVESGGNIYGSAYAEAASYYARWKSIVDLWNGDFQLEIPDYTPNLEYNGSAANKGSDDSSSAAEDTKKTYNWIETAIEKIQKAFSKLGAIAQNTYKTLTTRNNALSAQIKTVRNEIELQQTAYAAYMAKANSVGLSSDLREKVQKGAVNISEYDSKTAEIIDEYKEWYDKAQDCKDAIDDLHESIADLYKGRFENISKDFENQLSQIEHMSNMYNIGIDTAEAKGYLESVKYYASLQDSQRNSLSALNQQLAALKSAFTEAMNSGEIKMYSDAWYEMQDSINGVTEEIMKGEQQLAEYDKAMREIQWGHFDYLQERISQITQETEFLIDLLDNKNLFNDKGQFTDEGMAALGLYAQNYNVYMAQAEKYAREIRNIEEQMAKDPYNADLIKRKEELIKLQQESVVAAENEKQAMVDLVKEGIEKELTALKELIDAYTKTLDEAADLRNYQKKISEQAEQIANLKKQLSAKAGDTSEEAKADVQKLQVELQKAQEELQESEYERYVSEQKKLLDELYTDYEDALNGRLDDIDALIGELIGTVNENAGNIAAAIEAAANNVGYNLSDSIKTIWSSGTSDITNVVSLYGERFTDKLTAVNEALNRIEVNTAAMIAAAGTNAGNNSSAGNPAVPSNPSAGTGNSAGGGSSNGSSNSNGSSGGSTKPIRIGGKINAEGAPIYDYVGDTGGERQVFGNDPIYTVLDEINGYLKVRWHKLNSGVTGWFKRADVKAYKRGGIVNYTGLAQLDGSNSRPEYVLNADETKNYLALNETLKKLAAAGIFANMSRLNPISLVKPPDVGLNPVPRAGDAKFGDININIDHVEDYNDLVNKMRSDGRFEKMVQSMTVDRVAGRSCLAKNKFRW